MWLIFLVSCIVVALAALVVIWIGSFILRSIKRQDRKFDIEMEDLEQNKGNKEKEEE